MGDWSKRLVFLAAIVGVGILAALPLGLSAYGVSTGIVYFANVALATAWALFSGPTRYISLATAAFVGVGIGACKVLAEQPTVVAAAPVPERKEPTHEAHLVGVSRWHCSRGGTLARAVPGPGARRCKRRGTVHVRTGLQGKLLEV